MATLVTGGQKDFPENEDMQRGLRVRIGIHAGRGWYSEIYRGALDYYGSTVNMAARVESQALGGQIIVSEAVWLAITLNNSLDVVAKALAQQKLNRRARQSDRNCSAATPGSQISK